MTRIQADLDLCIGSGLCQAYAPTAFAVVDGKVVVLNPNDADPGAIDLAVDGCPMAALSKEDV